MGIELACTDKKQPYHDMGGGLLVPVKFWNDRKMLDQQKSTETDVFVFF